MDEVYMVSDQPAGPWMSLGIASTPQSALDQARANFEWPVVWVAKMRAIQAVDLMQTREMFFAEMQEKVAVLYGSQINEALDSFYKAFPYEVIEYELDKYLDASDVDAMVPLIKRPYGRDQNARPNDFKPTIEELEG